jgi:glycosyltransferase involved in cell wall biosynthesis
MNDRTKIIQVSAYYPPRLGGMQNVVREISERLAAEGEDVEVYTSTVGTKEGRIISNSNPKIHYVRGMDIAHTAIMPMLFFRLLRIPKNSIIHVHAPRPYVLEVTALVAKLKKIPYIVHVHSDIQPMGLLKFLIEPYKKYLSSHVLRGAALTLFVTEAQEEEFKDLYKLQRTAVLPNGVDDKFFIKRKPRSNNSKEEASILFVGRLNHHKNIPFIIEAVSLMQQKVKLNIVGEGELHNQLDAMIKKLKLNDKVKLHGSKSGDELIKQYREADIFVMASKSEGFSLSLLEAMASGLPVVVTNSPGLANFVRDTGMVVNTNNVKVFGQELDKLLSDSSLKSRLGKQSIAKAKFYQWQKVINSLKDIYKSTYGSTKL